ncbi:hypothetical protein [Methanimicrococcus blatticola]|uniref:Uncharacterized protein n=1 Tax=Methanimicrococcus blatticola TaxID=91560 RepID=A0A484F2E1_9EURY|nr:hypothetical protein [Methanimicrococcus blatticola]MBZ3935401.1 hypothetical protein [Methanimicrococcus blatticola]MCC2508501.1 hypothetical protein [Methanimicrococcus blatticola]TDQ67810.1 hypothetical protein C7391_1363 [Methanimicrococcus blatticola]
MIVCAHFFYYDIYLDMRLPLSLFLIGGWGGLLLLYAILAPKMSRTSDYSKIISVVGILIAFCSLILYVSYFLGVWENKWFSSIVSFIVLGYALFLSWYKNGWWG